MRVVPFPIAVAASLLLLSIPSTAFQPSTVAPGGTYACTVQVDNFGSGTRRFSARVRLSGDSFFGSPQQAAARGPWVEVGGEALGPWEWRQFAVELPVPARVPPVLSVEIRPRGGGFWSAPPDCRLAYAESALVPPGGEDGGPDRLPFRIVAGGRAAYDFGGGGELVTEVVRTVAEWDALRAYLGIVSPDSWGLPPPPGDGRSPDFASGTPPDPAFGTLLAFRTPDFDHCNTDQRRLWVRSVDRRTDGTLACRFSFRMRRIPSNGRVCPSFLEPGRWLLVAIPRTDAPVVFERVP